MVTACNVLPNATQRCGLELDGCNLKSSFILGLTNKVSTDVEEFRPKDLLENWRKTLPNIEKLEKEHEREGIARRYKSLADQDRPLPNVWEGVEGCMEHVRENFPMPQKAVRESRPAWSSTEKNVSRNSKRPSENSRVKHESAKKQKLVEPNLERCSDSDTSSYHPTNNGDSFKATDKTLRPKTLSEETEKEIMFGLKMEGEKDGKSTENKYDLEDSFFILDSCGDVDVIERECSIGEDNQVEADELSTKQDDADDLILALSSHGSSRTISCDFQTSSSFTFSENNGVKQNAVSEADLISFNPPVNSLAASSVSDAERNNSKQDTQSNNVQPKSPKEVLVSSPTSCAVTDSLQFERVLYQPFGKMEADSLKTYLQEQFSMFDLALKTLYEGFKIIKTVFLEKSRKHEKIEDSYLKKLSEVSCLIVALFSEMEIVRLSQAPCNNNKQFIFQKTCHLKGEDKQNFHKWYSTLKKKVKNIVSQYSKLYDEFSYEIIEYNVRVGDVNGIKIPGAFCFCKLQRFQTFVQGKLKVYKISSFLIKSNKSKENTLNPVSRYALCEPGSLFSTIPLKTTPTVLENEKNKNAPVTPKTKMAKNAEASFGLLGPCQETEGSHQFHQQNVEANVIHNTHKASSPLRCNTAEWPEPKSSLPLIEKSPLKRKPPNLHKSHNSFSKLEPMSKTSAELKYEKFSNYSEKMKADLQIPPGHENDPGFQSDTYHYFDWMIESMKYELKYVRKRLYVLTQNLAKDKTQMGPQTRKVCSELVKLGSKIQFLNVCFETERVNQDAENTTRKWKFSPVVVADIGPMAANHLNAKLTSLEIHLRNVYNLFNTLFCKHFEAIQAYNSSKDGKKNGEVVVPMKLDFLRKHPPKKGYYTNKGSYMKSKGNKEVYKQQHFKNEDIMNAIFQPHAQKTVSYENYAYNSNFEHSYVSENCYFNEVPLLEPYVNKTKERFSHGVNGQSQDFLCQQGFFYSDKYCQNVSSNYEKSNHSAFTSSVVSRIKNYNPSVLFPPLPPLPHLYGSKQSESNTSDQGYSHYAEAEDISDSFFGSEYPQEREHDASISRSFVQFRYSRRLFHTQGSQSCSIPAPATFGYKEYQTKHDNSDHLQADF
ncbi:hypothetical protein PoB_007517100 [Plakobranchus ocellatus]|uniref:Uncharacterized protein n=1 Tax=Plakobranchus ocellatus TaxID=259542 RepID=A0AAV4DX37_9GAST|nr:hypothetical protein PoB_007517100 [Plakobranchus ocellatus]